MLLRAAFDAAFHMMLFHFRDAAVCHFIFHYYRHADFHYDIV